MKQVAVVYHSGYGHTAKQAEAVASGAREGGAEVHLMNVDNVDWDVLAKVDAIIFGAPTYMGSASAQFKAFMDASSKVWFTRGWQDKLAAGFTNSASLNGDKQNTLTQLAVLAAQHGMLWVSLGLAPGNNSTQGSIEDLNRLGGSLGALAQSNADASAEVAPPATDLRTASALGKRVAEIAARFK